MKILFLIISPRSYDHGDSMNIDRPDLTRKLDIINTWALDAYEAGHEVVFFTGGSNREYYDDLLNTLYITEDDRYEPESNEEDKLSRIFLKIQAALRWAKDNKNFDMAYVCDDDIYVNMPEFLKLNMEYDYKGHGSLGGAGFLFNKKGIEALLSYVNIEHRCADTAIYDAMITNGSLSCDFNASEMAPYYIPGELQATIHYVTGKRAYFLHNIFRYYRENNYTNRKIIIGGPFNTNVENPFVSYEVSKKRKTLRWYDYTADPNGWEYHGEYSRSLLRVNDLHNFWPYGKKSTKYFVLNCSSLLRDYKEDLTLYKSHFDYLIKQCKHSLIDEANLILCFEEEIEVEGWTINNSVKESLKLNFELLQNCNFYTENKI
jgi:hypothetical protein